MSERVIRKSWDDIKPRQEVLDALDDVADEELERDIREDPDVAPILDEAWFRDAELLPARKMPVSLRLDPDILAFFKNQGPGYQTRINGVLRRYMEAVQRQERG
ncbi:BrnA antitoxin family protein [Rhodospira trueperi]|uniref:BrnA antitoxin of type II toxin-antitoxin system n=1 Tax=Rhodospira trueperi TaxID=69960 RepID=A0A1G7GCI4_9PROT|nr:BrnA antitoxin family protein [Rhodospira trueperi]SDE85840.1 BrnA antitoxin of type II toxin-antitoxin system [Rhodospira trueperi]